jgi:hypothetical protein
MLNLKHIPMKTKTALPIFSGIILIAAAFYFILHQGGGNMYASQNAVGEADHQGDGNFKTESSFFTQNAAYKGDGNMRIMPEIHAQVGDHKGDGNLHTNFTFLALAKEYKGGGNFLLS